MPFSRTLLWALLAFLTPVPAAHAQTAYANPVIGRLGVADPFVLKWNGEYYLYASGDPILAFHSTDLVTWTPLAPVLASSSSPDAWDGADVWAPEVVYRNGLFYLYYTASRASADWRVGEMARRVGVAVADSPRGPFVDAGHPVTPGWAIDGHVFQDPDDGAEYLFYSYLYEPRLPGAGLVVDRLLAPDRVAGLPAHVTRGSEAWEDKDGDPGNGSLRYTNEAPTVLKRDGHYYMMYSGGSWDRPTYALAYATADAVVPGRGLDGPGWAKVVPPILRSTPLVEAPGHNAVVKAPNNVDDITAYHARVVPFADPGDRQTFIARLFWNGDRPFLAPPSRGLQPAPDRPLFADRFDRPDGPLGAPWQLAGGTWRVEGGSLRAAPGQALVPAAPLHHYVFEANVRIASGAAAGVVAFYAGEGDRVDVWLDPARRALVTTGTRGGAALPESATSLPDGFRFDVFHQILVTKNAATLRVALDGVHAQQHTLPAAGAGQVGVQARGGAAFFDGLALTPFFEDFFNGPDTSWDVRGGAWMADEGALHQGAGGADRYLALKGDAASSYEIEASVRFRNEESVSATAGIAPAADAGGRLVLAGFDRTIWPYARFHVRYVVDGAVAGHFTTGLPRGFSYDAFHTIRAVRQGDAFTFFLDGQEMASARFDVGEARAGLYTEGVRAAFDDVRVKRVVVPRNPVLDGSFEAELWESADGVARVPWQLGGAASVVVCCAYDGIKRLRLADGGQAVQTVGGLEPGTYTLHAWAVGAGNEARAVVRVQPAGGDAVEATASSAAWQHVTLPFEVPRGARTATITLVGSGGPGASVALDNVYIVRQ